MSKKANSSVRTKGSHLTIEDRAKIEYDLNHGHTIRSMARSLDKSPSTIKREIERNCTVLKDYANSCSKLNTCNVHHACGRSDCNALCRNRCQTSCYKWCSEYSVIECERLAETPHVCNACTKFNRSIVKCNLVKKVYYASEAHEKYRELLTERRAGLDLTLDELIEIDKVVSPLIKKGQSPYHIIQNNVLPVSLSTLYRIVDSGELEAGNIDLKQKVRRKPRKTQRHGEKLSKRIQEAKLAICTETSSSLWRRMTLSTLKWIASLARRTNPPLFSRLHFPGLQMQLGFYLEDHTAFNVVLMLDGIEKILGTSLFRRAFPVILTDNGSEFADVPGIERSVFNHKLKRTNLFFCEPNRSERERLLRKQPQIDSGGYSNACEKDHFIIFIFAHHIKMSLFISDEKYRLYYVFIYIRSSLLIFQHTIFHVYSLAQGVLSMIKIRNIHFKSLYHSACKLK